MTSTLGLVIVVSLVGSIVSLIGGIYLIYSRKFTGAWLPLAVSFAAGALLSAAFIDLLPEALNDGSINSVTTWTLLGILMFFILERGLNWFHHHHSHARTSGRGSTKSLIIIGDTIHNFLDGLAIGAAFLVSPGAAVVATIAIAAHEIPQEIGDFGLLLGKGMHKRSVLLVNIISALATVVAASAVFLLGGGFDLPVPELLGVTAGFFIYIAVSDIIPTIHAESNHKKANWQTFSLLVGAAFVAVSTIYAERLL